MLIATFRSTPHRSFESFISKKGHHMAMHWLAADDYQRLFDFFLGLSPQTRRQRFNLSTQHNVADFANNEAQRLLRAKPNQHLVLLALAPLVGTPQIIAIAELCRDPKAPIVGELGLVVSDYFQNEGLGTALAECLLRHAMSQGVTTMRADLSAENEAVLRMVARLPTPYSLEQHASDIQLLAHLTPTF
jgi:RimJ/RimL family protein N-acetyltransferase